ncbi:MAG: hypothetical protein WBZ20_12350, partial [Nitrososphaeraceae archaeon]
LEIICVLKASNDRPTINKILDLLREDIRIRKTKYNVDSIDILYLGQTTLPRGLHLRWIYGEIQISIK